MEKSNLFYRVLTALVLIPVTLLIILYGNELFIFAILSIVVLLTTHELLEMLNFKDFKEKFLGFFLNFVVLYLILCEESLFLDLLVIVFFIIVIYSLFIKGIKNFIHYASLYLFSIIYIPFLLSFTYKVFLLPDGRIWLLFLLITNWMTDSFAYFVGIKFGKHKFSEISPKKSLEGLFGGVAGGVIVAFLFNYFAFKTDKWSLFILLGILGSLIGQISDLIESGIKRSVGVKDSGSLIPGHGGVLDRLDSLFLTGPLFYFFGNYFLG